MTRSSRSPIPTGIPDSLPVHYDHVAEGFNLAMNPIDAAVLTVKLSSFHARIQKRRDIGRWYEAQLADMPEVMCPALRPESEPAYREYTIQVPDRDLHHRRLQEAGIQTALHYVPPVHQQPVYRDRNLPGAAQLAVTESLAANSLCLPVTPELRSEDIEHVVDTLGQSLKT